jgi:hypothetical protein
MATKKTSAKKTSNLVKGVEAGAALAAVAGAAAGYYFYGTQHAKKHRQAATTWAKGLKKDVHTQVKNLKKIDAKSVAKIVDQASKSYQTAKGASKSDVMMAAKELKANWKAIQAELAPSKKAVKAVKKTVKKVEKAGTKKAVQRAVKKAVKAVSKKKK